MQKKHIKIAGAGIAGLTAAINLAKAGYKVTVYEKSSQVGGHYPENPQLLPNWFSEEDIIEELEKCNVKISWARKIKELQICLPQRQITISGKKTPIGYTVLRGSGNSLEKSLSQSAKKLGVKIITNSPVNEEKQAKMDIMATGAGQLITLGYARVYKGNFNPAKVKVGFDPNYSPTIGYCYFFPHGPNKATLKISKAAWEKDIDFKERLTEFRSQFLPQQVKEENLLYEFSTKRSFKVPQTAISGKSLLVGEAAGFQDELFRFGIRYAVLSGYLASKAIIENLDYDVLWKKRFLSEFQKTKRSRRVFEALKKDSFKNLPNTLNYIDMEKFKRIWLSKSIHLLAVLPLFLQRLFFNKFALKIASQKPLR